MFKIIQCCHRDCIYAQMFDAGAISVLQLYTAHSTFEPHDDSYAPLLNPERVLKESNGTFHVQRFRGIEPAQFLSEVIGYVVNPCLCLRIF
jgi:hypothetical protein